MARNEESGITRALSYLSAAVFVILAAASFVELHISVLTLDYGWTILAWFNFFFGLTALAFAIVFYVIGQGEKYGLLRALRFISSILFAISLAAIYLAGHLAVFLGVSAWTILLWYDFFYAVAFLVFTIVFYIIERRSE
jgi:hypothetical protein